MGKIWVRDRSMDIKWHLVVNATQRSCRCSQVIFLYTYFGYCYFFCFTIARHEKYLSSVRQKIIIIYTTSKNFSVEKKGKESFFSSPLNDNTKLTLKIYASLACKATAQHKDSYKKGKHFFIFCHFFALDMLMNMLILHSYQFKKWHLSCL